MSNAGRQPVVPMGKSISAQLHERREGQALDTESAMEKLAPEGLDLNPPKANPLEIALPHMEQVQIELEQLVEVARNIYRKIEEIKNSGDASGFLDPALRSSLETWEAKAKEIASIKNKLVVALPMNG
jgi:hypothetical protein